MTWSLHSARQFKLALALLVLARPACTPRHDFDEASRCASGACAQPERECPSNAVSAGRCSTASGGHSAAGGRADVDAGAPTLGGNTGADGEVLGGMAGGLSQGGALPSNGGASSGGATSGGAISGVGGAGSGSLGGRASGGASAGSAGAGAADAGAGGSPELPPDPCAAKPGVVFCDDFEARTPGAFEAKEPWSLSIHGVGRVTVDSKQSHSGSRAIHVQGNGYSTYLVYSDSKVLPNAARRLYLRAFVRLAMPMTEGLNVFVSIDDKELSAPTRTFQLGEMNKMLMYSAGSGQSASANENYYLDFLPGRGFEAGAWSCLEVLIDSAAGDIAVWLDEREIPDLRRNDLILDTYDRLRFGFENFTGPATELWYDDIAIGSERIGCD